MKLAEALSSRGPHALAAMTLLCVVALALVGCDGQRAPARDKSTSRPSATSTLSPSPKSPDAYRQSDVPLAGLKDPNAVAVDAAGAIYVTDAGNRRVLKLAAGSTSQTELPFTGLQNLTAIAVDPAGNVYVTDFNDGYPGVGRVVRLAAGSNAQSTVPITDLADPRGIAIDPTGGLYIADRRNKQVVNLPAGSASQRILPFRGLESPSGVAVDAAGAVYVTDVGTSRNRVLKLPSGSTSQTELPFTGLNQPTGVAVDRQGTVYITDLNNRQVLKLAAGSTSPVELPLQRHQFARKLERGWNGRRLHCRFHAGASSETRALLSRQARGAGPESRAPLGHSPLPKRTSWCRFTGSTRCRLRRLVGDQPVRWLRGRQQCP